MDIYKYRRDRVTKLADAEGMDGVLVTHLPDVRYLSGFSGSSGMVLLLSGRGYFLTDFRYREQSASEVRGLKVLVYDHGPAEALEKVLEDRSGLKLGFDSSSLVYGEVLALRRSLKGKARVLPLKRGLSRIRAVKSRGEIALMAKALRLAEAAFREALETVGEDTRERELAAALDSAARLRGAEGGAFETIVTGGVRGAMVHASPSGHRLRGAVVVDWGVRYRGYYTDMTRTLALGRMSSPLRKAYSVVVEAQERALERIRPGVSAASVDRAARELIEREGYGDCFGHGLGHGVGLEVHERPYITGRSKEVIEEGMVFTIEPGIYLPGEGGVRVEDMVLVKGDGAELLSTLPRSLDPGDY